MTISRLDQTGRASAGSQRQVQTYVNERQDVLTKAVCEVLPVLCAPGTHLRWVSPLKQNGYVEYQDNRFLKALCLEQLSDSLQTFWPRGGPVWDALALVESNSDGSGVGVVMVEAKSYPDEIRGIGCRASRASRPQIEKALAVTKQWLGVPVSYDWMGPYYQSANRLAHLYFLREIGHVCAWLINLYFVDDRHSPTSREKWRQELAVVRTDMGLAHTNVPLTAELFLDAAGEEGPGIDELLKSKREAILQIAARHGAHHVRVFGSVALGTATSDSDIDVLVEFEPNRSLLDTIALMRELEDLLGRSVDVVTEQALHSYIRADVLRQARAL